MTKKKSPERRLDLIRRLYENRCKIRRFPAGGWSRGGNKFQSSRNMEQMWSDGIIDRIATTNQGIELFDLTDYGRKLHEATL